MLRLTTPHLPHLLSRARKRLARLASLLPCVQCPCFIVGGLSTQGPGATRAPTYAELLGYVKQELAQ